MTANERAEALHKSLTNQPPLGPEIVARFEAIRGEAKDYGSAVIALTPPSREQSLALTKLEESVMWAVKAIALNQEQLIEQDEESN